MDKVKWHWWMMLIMSIGGASLGQEIVYTNCGGTLQDPRGIIVTPNFPKQYPIPISCRWVIEAPVNKVIAIYFTQFYMREGVKLTEYAFFADNFYAGKHEFDPISSDNRPTYLLTNKPILVFEFVVREIGNIHLRIREYFLDVFGFNITYEIMDKTQAVKKDGCINHHCSYTGRCLAAADYHSYYCDCFDTYYGDECQHSPLCGPSGSLITCQNGGTCRYYIGSSIHTCECLPNFEGEQCEKRKDIAKLMRDGTQYIWNGLIMKFPGIACPDSILGPLSDRLMSSGCLLLLLLLLFIIIIFKGMKKNMSKFVGFILFTTFSSWCFFSNCSEFVALKIGNLSTILYVWKLTLSKLFNAGSVQTENLTVLSIKSGLEVQFHFFGKKEDSAEAKRIMEDAYKSGRIEKFHLAYDYFRFESEPPLQIQDLEASERIPVIEGTEFNLACIIQGSSDIKVKWYKDNRPINVDTLYRNIWMTLVPKNSKQQYTAILGFDKIDILDSGVFTCEVIDWGIIQNQNITVTVTSTPKPKIHPLTATVKEGENVIITCLSEESVYGNFGYNWLKNGKILNPSSEPELIEDLFPTGSRIILQSIITSTVYTCIITSSAGAIRKDSVITVLTSDRQIPTCSPEKFMKINWSLAAANTEDIHRCPSGYSGNVKRQCVLKKESGAFWDKPNFSECLSKEFLEIRKKFNSLKLGYQITDIGSLLYELKGYLNSKKTRYHVAEGEPVVDFLEEVLNYQQKNLQLYYEIHNNSKVFLDVVSILLDSPNLIQKQSQVLKLHQQVINYGLLQGHYIEENTFVTHERSALVIEVGQIQNEGHHILTFPSSRSSRSKQKEGYPLLPAWMTDSIELNFNTWLLQDFYHINTSINIAVVFYKNFSAFLPERFLNRHGSQDMEYQLHSRLISVAIQTGEHMLGTKSLSLKIIARLAHLNHTVNQQITWNISCGLADFSQGVHFSMEGCHPVHKENFSICQCDRVGTYAVLLTTYAQIDDFHVHEGFEIIAGIGCAICAFLISFCLLLLLILWRHIKGAITALKIQVCLALLGAYITIMIAISDILHEKYYPHIVSLIQFFLLAALCMQLCLGLTIYTELVNLRNIRYLELKIASMGWGKNLFFSIYINFQFVQQVVYISFSFLEGFSLESWWLKIHTNYFYAYVTSVLAISFFQVLLFLTVKAELRCHLKIDPLKQNKLKNRSRLLHRSLIISSTLLLVSFSSILYINFDDSIFKYFFSLCSAFLGLVIFGCYTVCSENPHSPCNSDCPIDEEGEKHEPRVRTHSNSFKSFLQPDIEGEVYCANRLEESVNLERRADRTRWMRSQIQKSSQNKEIKEADCLLKNKGISSEGATIHDFRNKQGKDNNCCNNSDSEGGFQDFDDEHTPPSFRRMWRKHREKPNSPPFELQVLEGSPRNSQINIQEQDDVISEGEQESFYIYNEHQRGGSDSIILTHSGNSSPSCQLLLPSSSIRLSEMSDSCSSQSSGADEHSAFASSGSVKTIHYNPYRPSSLLQFEGLAIREEDETEIISEEKLNYSPNRKDTTLLERIVIGNSSNQDNGNAPSETIISKHSIKKDGLIADLPSEVDLQVIGNGCEAKNEENYPPQSKKGWSITTV
ncbi:uncharacterized protein LOC111623639 [Centruroides sculpturatus]|uniref:uncharacterized protein LOC111623639 n=1 Tax=Centruroides sculpturatus TaxID=218467 RepID=UPI000C6D05C5|nr:uncharacterized protein LOC111623639 [Centruroides sculpturatus]